MNEADDIGQKSAPKVVNDLVVALNRENVAGVVLVHRASRIARAGESAHCTGMCHHQVNTKTKKKKNVSNLNRNKKCLILLF